ncbi:V-type ATP synthase subunit F [Ruminococcaceae bacterium OttesenSCG-928-D13]|nr:V-type ATP synthase subunit F [Ruminococcaceae bacterium OttesenSCG-928-D13]
MKYFLISDNIDTLAGLRMVGVDGVVVHEQDEVRAAIKQASGDDEVGLILITSRLFKDYSTMIFDFKMHQRKPLIVEMPDRHSGDNVADSIKQYIQEVVGIKL